MEPPFMTRVPLEVQAAIEVAIRKIAKNYSFAIAMVVAPQGGGVSTLMSNFEDSAEALGFLDQFLKTAKSTAN